MNIKNYLSKQTIITTILFLILGFFLGMEYKKYQIASALDSAFEDIPEMTSLEDNEEISSEKAEEEPTIINSSVDGEIELSAMNLKVTSVTEEQTVSDRAFGSPVTARDGAKFVVVEMEVTNTTKSPFTFDDDIPLVDSKGREFDTYEDTIGSIDNYLNVRKLSPNIQETGVLLYEIPEDAESYNLRILKEGTNEIYSIKLK